MAIRRWNVTHLLENGNRLIPWKLIFHYRYIRDNISTSTQAYVNIYGTVHSGNPVTIGLLSRIYIPTENEMGMSKFSTEIMDMQDKLITGIYLDVYNSEYIEIKEISLDYRSGIIQNGDLVNPDAIELSSFTINNGAATTTDVNLVTTNTMLGTPTQYRIGIEDDLSDGTWTTYSNTVNYTGTIGINTLYFQARNATTESLILSDSIEVLQTYTQFLQDVDDIRNNPTTDFTLERDLDFNENSSYDQTDVVSETSIGWQAKKIAWTTGEGWDPIDFYGAIFDGAGFTISNLYINRPLEDNLGLFGFIANIPTP